MGNISPSNHWRDDIFDINGIIPSLTACDYKNPRKIGIVTDRVNCKIRRGVVQKDSTGTLNTQKGNWGTVTSDYRIRRLTPRECERLQGFPDDWTKYGKDDELISDTQRYKCCGNAVTTNVITAIINEVFDNEDG